MKSSISLLPASDAISDEVQMPLTCVHSNHSEKYSRLLVRPGLCGNLIVLLSFWYLFLGNEKVVCYCV